MISLRNCGPGHHPREGPQKIFDRLRPFKRKEIERLRLFITRAGCLVSDERRAWGAALKALSEARPSAEVGPIESVSMLPGLHAKGSRHARMRHSRTAALISVNVINDLTPYLT